MSNMYVPASITCAVGGVGAAALATVSGYPWGSVVGVGGVLAGVAVVVFGRRRAARRRLHESLEAALAPVLGPARVISRRWKGWIGAPRQIRLAYSPAAKDDDPAWRQAIVEVTQRRLGVTTKIVKHDRRRRRILLTTTTKSAASNPIEQRVARTVSDLLGAGAKLAALQQDDQGNPTQFEVRQIPTTKVAASAGYRAKIERTIGTVHQGRWRAHWDLEADRVHFELRPKFPTNIWLPRASVDTNRDVLASYDKVKIDYGVDEDGNILHWQPAIDPNLMVVGAPGTGKTVLEHNILVSVSQWGWPIWVVDGKAIEFLGWRTWPNVQIVASTVEEQVAVITRAHEVMEHRYQLIVTGRASEDDFEPLMVFIDEWSDFRANLTDWYSTVKVKGMPTKAAVLQKVASIARKGRSSRVHLLFATQRPDAEYFGGDMRDNFRCRISMGRLSPQGAMMMYQDPTIGTAVPRGCRGRATTIDDNNRPVEIQTYRVPDPRKAHRRTDTQELDILEALTPDTTMSRHQRLLIVPPSPDDIDQAGSAYTAWCAADWVPATARPDLDPDNNHAADPTRARQLASPMAMFGLSAPPPSAVNSIDAEVETVVEEEASEELGVLDGYGPSCDVDPLGLSVGDLVEIEPGRWATIDEAPEEDPMDPGQVLLCWRDDQDEAGVVAVGFGERVMARQSDMTEAA